MSIHLAFSTALISTGHCADRAGAKILDVYLHSMERNVNPPVARSCRPSRPSGGDAVVEPRRRRPPAGRLVWLWQQAMHSQRTPCTILQVAGDSCWRRARIEEMRRPGARVSFLYVRALCHQASTERQGARHMPASSRRRSRRRSTCERSGSARWGRASC